MCLEGLSLVCGYFGLHSVFQASPGCTLKPFHKKNYRADQLKSGFLGLV